MPHGRGFDKAAMLWDWGYGLGGQATLLGLGLLRIPHIAGFLLHIIIVVMSSSCYGVL